MHEWQRVERAESLVSQLLRDNGWSVDVEHSLGEFRPDLMARCGSHQYAIEIKAAAEGRSDRLVPLFAQAALQAKKFAGQDAVPLAIVVAPQISPRAAENLFRFAGSYAPGVAVGVIDLEGFRAFRGPLLEGLNVEPLQRARVPAFGRLHARQPAHLFADLNQWMLKVLLANELPSKMLSAPRGLYRNASQLARAAQVSVMSAFRLVQQLKDEGYLHESAPYLKLVRRQHLFERWQAAIRPFKEVPMRLVLGSDVRAQLPRILDNGEVCLALFAAADALDLGFVEGVPPYVYVERVQPSSLVAWKNLRPCAPGEAPHVIIRQAPVPQSIFRGMVRPDGLACCDVLQVWIDVASHPARGREQADYIREHALAQLINYNK